MFAKSIAKDNTLVDRAHIGSGRIEYLLYVTAMPIHVAIFEITATYHKLWVLFSQMSFILSYCEMLLFKNVLSFSIFHIAIFRIL